MNKIFNQQLKTIVADAGIPQTDEERWAMLDATRGLEFDLAELRNIEKQRLEVEQSIREHRATIAGICAAALHVLPSRVEATL